MNDVIEHQCRSLLNRVSTSATPFRWSVNPYRGCRHACTYCYGRRYHEYLNMSSGSDFERRIIVKINAPEVLHRELSHLRWQPEAVAIGTAVDPYQPLEAKYRITRSLLGVFLAHHTPVTIITKNTLILRDIDLLRQLSAGPGCTVYMSISTVNAQLARKCEPDTPPPLRRLDILQQLVSAGIKTGVLLAPIMPGLTDSSWQLEECIAAAASHRAAFLHAAVLRLEGSVKGVYLNFIRKNFPVLEWKYAQLYRGAHAPKSYRDRVLTRVATLCRDYQIPGDEAHCAAQTGHEAESGSETRGEVRLWGGQAQLMLAL